MKRKIPVFLVLILISGTFLFISCSDKAPIVGNLTVTAKTTSTGVSLTDTPIYLATSKDDLDNQISVIYSTLDANGSRQFRDLAPKYYWYKVQGWDDIGAVEVFAGTDESVILYLNSPSSKK
jgi:hypothetical protein